MTARKIAERPRVDPRREGKRGGGLGARTRPVLRTPELWEFEILRLIAEQQAVPVDQLARFVGCNQLQAERLGMHLAESGFAVYDRFLCEEPHWVWLSERGVRLSGTGFVYLRPRVGVMARIRAVNEVRLHVARRAPDARWICARSVVHEQGRYGHRPHAVVEIGSERHAILLARRAQRPDLFRERLETHMARYDAVVAFADPRPRALLERLAAEHHWPKLIVRAIPGPS